MSVTIEMRGFDEALEHLAKYDAKKCLAKAVEMVTRGMHSYAVEHTPVVTGSMQRAWRSVMRSPLVGQVFIDPSAVNSLSGVSVISYAPTIADKYGLVDDTIAEGTRAAEAALAEVFDGF